MTIRRLHFGPDFGQKEDFDSEIKCSNATSASLRACDFCLSFGNPANFQNQAPVVQTMDSAIRRINHYPLDNSIGFASDCLSAG